MNTQQKEEQLIGFLILSPSYVAEAIKKIKPEDFSTEKCRKVYSILIEAFIKDEEIDEVIISEKYGDIEVVNKLVTDNILTSASFLQFLKDIKEASDNRQLLQLSADLTEAVKSHNKEKIENIKQKLLETNKVTDLEPQDIKNLALQYLENYNLPKKDISIESGIPKLDMLTDGFQKGDFITLSAKTGIGKTNLCLDFALHALKHKKKVLFITLEMLPNQLIDRLIAMQGLLDAYGIKKRLIEQTSISNTLNELKEMNLKILFASEFTSLDLFSVSYTEKILNGLDIVFLDYLGRLSDKFYTSEEERLTRICRNLKNCALKLQIPVISPIQIDKTAAKASGVPAVEDAKGSTSIGHESDLSLALTRKDRTSSESKLYITKNRHGNCGDIDLFFDLKTLRFTELTSDDKISPNFESIQKTEIIEQPIEVLKLPPEQIPF